MNTAKQQAICYRVTIRRGSKTPKKWWAVWRWIERILFTGGLSLLALYGAVRLEGCLSSSAAIKNFEDHESLTQPAAQDAEEVNYLPESNFSGWAESRVRAYKTSPTNRFGSPMAVLQIPAIHLAVPLLDGTDNLTLNHAVGHIDGTARPGEPGNIGIAGHRDGFFRGLKDIKPKDVIEMRTQHGTDTYEVDEIQIVTPDNVGVLRPRDVASLTLVTCYPFYFIGSAPKRFVVTAYLTQSKPAGATTSETRPVTQLSNSTKEQQ